MAKLSLIPGVRFNPTDEVLVVYYLKRKILGKKIASNAVAEVNVYDFCPWDLPDKSSLKSGDLEWYFFCPNFKKYSNGGRANRATKTGFWKATGKGRMVKYRGRTVATIKTLVFHLGRAKECKRTNWVLHEYRMDDEQLTNAGVVQDTYVLCRLFEKSGVGPKNGAQYGAPFNEDEWDDDLVSAIDSQAIAGLVGASSTVDHKQNGPATTAMTEPGSSVVTLSANEPTNTSKYKQKGPATTDMTEPGSSAVSLSANKPTSTLNDKQKGPATTNLTGPGSSTVMLSADEPTDTLNYKQKGPATVDMIVPQTTHGLSITEPGPSSVAVINEMPASDDGICLGDIDVIMEAPEGAANEDDGIYGDLVSLFDLEDLSGKVDWNGIKTDEAEYILDKLPRQDDLDMGRFYVD